MKVCWNADSLHKNRICEMSLFRMKSAEMEIISPRSGCKLMVKPQSEVLAPDSSCMRGYPQSVLAIPPPSQPSGLSPPLPTVLKPISLTYFQFWPTFLSSLLHTQNVPLPLVWSTDSVSSIFFFLVYRSVTAFPSDISHPRALIPSISILGPEDPLLWNKQPT